MADFDPLGLFKNLKTLNKLQKSILMLSFLIFIISMMFPAFYIDRKDYDAYSNGWFLLFLGWLGLIIGDLKCLVWLANPIFLLALFLFLNRNKLSIILSLSAMIIGFIFSTFIEIYTDEEEGKSKITSLEMGYKLWIASFAILFIGTLIDFILSSRPGTCPHTTE